VVDVAGREAPAEAALVERVDRLARELLAQPTPDEVLDRTVQLAAQGIEGAASVSVSLLDRRRTVTTAAASDDLARTGDALQYRLGEGPCLDAVWTAEVVHCPDLTGETRWPSWGPAAAADLALGSMLSVRLATPDRTLGSLNLYGRREDAFDPAARTLAASFAAHAAIAYVRAAERQNLETALASRNLIGQAQGILMERHKITAEKAFEVLVTASQEGNTRLVEVARRVVETGVTPPPATR
jgi:transcriptional regulator with GAF, ATPase, and Fis domain